MDSALYILLLEVATMYVFHLHAMHTLCVVQIADVTLCQLASLLRAYGKLRHIVLYSNLNFTTMVICFNISCPPFGSAWLMTSSLKSVHLRRFSKKPRVGDLDPLPTGTYLSQHPLCGAAYSHGGAH